MMKQRRPRRQKRADRLTSPHSTETEIECDYALGPVDQVARTMDRKWGVERLPDLVSVETATKFGKAVASLNAAIDANDPEATRENANNMIRAYHALDAEAEQRGAPRACPDIWEVEVDGVAVGIMRDGTAWQEVKAQRPDLTIYSMREVAIALQAYKFSGEALRSIKEHFPAAQVKSIKPAEPVDYANGGDKIPF